ncbi:hypothetical protein HS1genome_1582 [Sulfodiicoccus acidiphilus]|uniref:HEPN domain-containing protein n=1 Tax=Sulfodiicoccus acidiphilus TaxID=1670455 RepID=A0A348B4U1_9CREN|nr:hypothetical protein HS1genome_1582 [Sulfodiicoccus acidiphilus]GGU01413.1 hypothetical protein GCM10007116_18270 [Sulfodiicoccus acidiphilus]
MIQLIQDAHVEIHQCTAFLNKQYFPTRYADVHDEGSPLEYYTEKDAEEFINPAFRMLN